MGRFFNYQHGLALLTGLVTCLVFADRNAINFLSPFLVPDLKLTNAQLGTASSVVSLTWAGAGYLIGRRSDNAGRRKPYYIATIVIFSLCSMASGLAGGFPGLVLTRLLMGAAEGPVLVLGLALLMGASTPSRRGMNTGLSALGGGLIGALAPFVLVNVAAQLGWRAAFFLTGIPGLILAVVAGQFVREAPYAGTLQPAFKKRSNLDVLRVRNVWLCGVISTFLVGGVIVANVFVPVFLMGVRYLKPAEMGMVMSAFVLASTAGGPILFALSDRLGRKPVLIGCAILAAASLCSLYAAGTATLLTVSMVAAGLGAGIPGMSIGMIPLESVAESDRATAMGATMGAAEIIGGFSAPALAGLAADHFGQNILPAVAAGCILAGGLISLALSETAPRRTGAAANLTALAPSE